MVMSKFTLILFPLSTVFVSAAEEMNFLSIICD